MPSKAASDSLPPTEGKPVFYTLKETGSNDDWTMVAQIYKMQEMYVGEPSKWANYHASNCFLNWVCILISIDCTPYTLSVLLESSVYKFALSFKSLKLAYLLE